MTRFGEYFEDISFGRSYRCVERPLKHDEVGILKVSAGTWGLYDDEKSKTAFQKSSLIKIIFLKG